MRYENNSSFCGKVEGVSPNAEGDVCSPGIPWHILNPSALAQPSQSQSLSPSPSPWSRVPSDGPSYRRVDTGLGAASAVLSTVQN